MKIIYTLIFFIIFSPTFAQNDSTKINLNQDSLKALPATLIALHDGELSDPQTFGGNLPKAGDNIIIPYEIKVTVSNEVNFNNSGDPATTIYNAGILAFGVKGKLLLSNGSILFGNEKSTIDRESRENIPVIKIGNATFYGGADTTLTGWLVFPTNANYESFLNVCTYNKNHFNVINWSTLRESHLKEFQVMKSNNGINWQVIAKVPATGNSHSIRTYLFTDNNPESAVCYYRLKSIDNSGKGQYSCIRSAKNEARGNLSAR